MVRLIPAKRRKGVAGKIPLAARTGATAEVIGHDVDSLFFDAAVYIDVRMLNVIWVRDGKWRDQMDGGYIVGCFERVP